MKVKVGNQVYDGKKQPVMVILSQLDKENIAQMAPGARRYCAYPKEMDASEIRSWMSDGLDVDDRR